MVEWWLSGRPLRLLRRDAGGHRRLSSCGALCTRRDHSLVAGRRQRVGMSPATARPWWQPADRGSWRSTAAIRPGSPPPLPCRSPGCGGPSRRTSSPAMDWPAWTSIRLAAGTPGTGGSPWPCSLPSSSPSQPRLSTPAARRPTVRSRLSATRSATCLPRLSSSPYEMFAPAPLVHLAATSRAPLQNLHYQR